MALLKAVGVSKAAWQRLDLTVKTRLIAERAAALKLAYENRLAIGALAGRRVTPNITATLESLKTLDDSKLVAIAQSAA